jgi:hypothetical protein
MLLVSLLGPVATAQIDTTRGRYYQPIFANVDVQRGVVYGQAGNILGANQTLRLDIYQPAGDTVSRRPLIVFAHEGAFVTGSRDDQFMTAICTRLARMGYVTASIDYRLLFFVGLGQAAIRATQDMRAAVRFFRLDAAMERRYRIHPGYIFAGGSSAGGFVALQVGYLDKPAEVPAYLNISQLGGLEGNSGNPGYSSEVRGVINLSGALGRLSWLEPGSVPLCSVHGTADTTVPFGAGTVGLRLPPQVVYGSGAIKIRADAVGVPNVLRALRGAGHVPYNGSSPSSVAYFDTTFHTIRDFLRPLLRQPGTVLSTPRGGLAKTGPQVYPVPATNEVRLTVPRGMVFKPQQVEMLDASGKVVRRFRWEEANQLLLREGLKAGSYLLRGEQLPTIRVLFE